MYFQLLLQWLVEVWNERLKLTSLPLILLQQQVWIILEWYGTLHVYVMVAGYILPSALFEIQHWCVCIAGVFKCVCVCGGGGGGGGGGDMCTCAHVHMCIQWHGICPASLHESVHQNEPVWLTFKLLNSGGHCEVRSFKPKCIGSTFKDVAIAASLCRFDVCVCVWGGGGGGGGGGGVWKGTAHPVPMKAFYSLTPAPPPVLSLPEADQTHRVRVCSFDTIMVSSL